MLDVGLGAGGGVSRAVGAGDGCVTCPGEAVGGGGSGGGVTAGRVGRGVTGATACPGPEPAGVIAGGGAVWPGPDVTPGAGEPAGAGEARVTWGGGENVWSQLTGGAVFLHAATVEASMRAASKVIVNSLCLANLGPFAEEGR